MRAADVTRVHYGYVVAPEHYPDGGQPVLVSGFVIRHPAGSVLFDTGMSPFDDDARQAYHPRRRSATEALLDSDIDPKDIALIANCHLHFDHAGCNYEFPGIPIYVQRAELEVADTPDYTYPQFTHRFDGARLEIIDGEVELLPDLRLVPTPGHTNGHQSLLVSTDEGVIMLAGQASNTTWEFSASALAQRLDDELHDSIGSYPDWMTQLRGWGVTKALFAHDLLTWERDGDLGHPKEE